MKIEIKDRVRKDKPDETKPAIFKLPGAEPGAVSPKQEQATQQ